MFHQSAFLLLAVVAAIFASSSAQVVFGRGACPVTGTKPAFDLSQYLGTWYEYERFDNWFEIGMVCGRAVYGDNGDGTISVTNAGLREVKIFGRTLFSRPDSVDGTASVPDATKPAELKVSFSEFDRSTKANYFVVDTDYTNYAVVFSCTQLPGRFFNIQFAWILTRVQGEAPANLAQIKADLQTVGVDTNKFKPVRQTGCSPTLSSNTVA